MDMTRISDLPRGGGGGGAMGGSENIRYEFQGQSGSGSGSGSGFQGPPNLMNYSMPTIPSSPATGGMIPGNANTYMPLNIHPNPFATSQGNDGAVQPGMMPMPEYQMKPNMHADGANGVDMFMGDMGANAGSGGMTRLDDIPVQRLPSRDIPRETLMYATDEEIHANYVPKPEANRRKDFNREEAERRDWEEYDAAESVRDHRHRKERRRWWEEWTEGFELPLLIALLYFVYQTGAVTRGMHYVFGAAWLRGLFYRDDGQLGVYGMVLKSVLFAAAVWSASTAVQEIA